MTTSYKNRPVRSPVPPSAYRPQKPSQPERDEHPFTKEVRELSQTIDLSVSFEADSGTMSTMSHIPGFIGVLCTIRRNGEVIAEGRGSSCVNRQNKPERTLNSVLYGSFLSACNHAARILEAQRIKSFDDEREMQKRGYGEAYRMPDTTEPMTAPQRRYIEQLVSQMDGEEREQVLSNLDSLSKLDASELIENLKSN